jgi:hypothetical protein
MQSLIDLAEIHRDLHQRFKPHEGQVPIGRAILYEKCKKVFANCGRSFGKSKINAYLHARIARENENSTNYIFLPFLTQGKEVYWTPKLLQQLIPEDEILSINNTEMRIILTNGSQIKVCGADNVESYRGVKPNPNSIITFEEAKDLKREFIDAFLPNLSVNDPILFIVGTPPEFESPFTEFMELAKNSPEWRYFHAPTSTNPYVSKKFIEDERIRLTNIGEEETFLREYEAIFVKGGKKTIYPQFLKLSPQRLDEILPIDLNKWELWVSHDPASTSIYGVLFALFNPYSKKIIVIDEIYESEPSKMTAKEINKAIKEKLKPYKDKVKTINYCYDEAAAWLKNEMGEVAPDVWLIPSQKARFRVDGYINLVRAVLNAELLSFNGECKSFIKEHEEYSKDDNGRIPKRDDHLVNCLHYLCGALGLNLDELSAPKEQEDTRRGYALHTEFQENEYKELD